MIAKSKESLLIALKNFNNRTPSMTEEEVSNLLSICLEISPDPEFYSYLFNKKKFPNLSEEEAVEKAFSYKPIILGPPPPDDIKD